MIQLNTALETIKPVQLTTVLENDDLVFKGDGEINVDTLTGISKALPVYRFFERNTGVNFYTTCEIQRKAITKLNNLGSEEIVCLAYPTKVDGSIPTYRFCDLFTGAHYDVFFNCERNQVTTKFPELQFVGIAYYALPI